MAQMLGVECASGFGPSVGRGTGRRQERPPISSLPHTLFEAKAVDCSLDEEKQAHFLSEPALGPRRSRTPSMSAPNWLPPCWTARATGRN